MRTLAIAIVLALAAMGRAAFAQDCTGWAPIGDPSPRLSPSLSLDTARGVVVMFGGGSAGTFNSPGTFSTETWEFDGRRWVFRTLEGPHPRLNALMAYDPVRQRTVMVGGYLPSTVQGSYLITWEWDGSTWTQHAAAPSHSTESAMEYMPGLGVVLFSPGLGYATQQFVWDGVAWTLHSTSPESTSVQTDAVYDPVRGAMIIARPTGTFAWDGLSFTQILPADATRPRNMTFVPARGKVVGFRYGSGAACWELGGAGWTQVAALPAGMAVTSPPTGADNLAAEQLADGRLFVCGNVSPANWSVNSWRLDADSFTPIVRRGPIGTDSPAMAFDPMRGVSVVTGGRITATQFDTNVWELRGDTWKHRGTHASGGREAGAMAFHPGLNAVVLTGGSSGDARTWSWDGSAWSLLSGAANSGGYGNLEWDPTAAHLVYHRHDGLARRWDGAAWVNGPTFSGGLYPAVEFEPVRNRFIAVGMSSGVGTYGFNGTTWSQLITTTQTSRYSPLMAYDARLGGLVLLGGFNALNSNEGNFANRTYFLASQAAAWVDLGERGPLGRKFSGVARDTLAERTVIHAGLGTLGSGINPRDTWKFATGPAAVAVQPGDVAAPAGASAELFIVAKGGGVISYQWRRNGTPLADDERTSGATSDTLVMTALSPGDNGLYDCIVSNACATDSSEPARLSVGCTADFDADGDAGTDADIEAFFACLAGECCPTCGTADFDNDGDNGTDADIEAFFRVLAGGSC